MDIKILASGSKGNCYRISDGETSLLLDAGINIKTIKQKLYYKLHEISACLITHEHGDHIKAAADLAAAGIDTYMSLGTYSVYHMTHNKTSHRIHIVYPSQKTFTVGTFSVLPFDVEHDAAEPLGYLLYSNKTHEKLLYFTDSYYLRYKFSELNYILGEVNYDGELMKDSVAQGYIPAELAPRLYKSHMSLEHFIDFLKSNDTSKLKAIYLLHLSSSNADPETFKRKVQAVTGAEVYIA